MADSNLPIYPIFARLHHNPQSSSSEKNYVSKAI